MRKFTVTAATRSYPEVTVQFEGQDIVSGKLDSSAFVQDIIRAMATDDEFASAMADFYDPEYNNMAWEDATYEEIALGIVDFCKSDYREWKSLAGRGREDNNWVVISDDESIVIS